jgi:tellurite resistance protein
MEGMELLVRNTELDSHEAEVCLRGISQVIMADGVQHPNERAYLEQFVEAYYSGTGPQPELLESPITATDLGELRSDTTKRCFLEYAYITAYVDGQLDPSEEDLIRSWARALVSEPLHTEILRHVREFLLRRSVFSAAFRTGWLDAEVIEQEAIRFGVPLERAQALSTEEFQRYLDLRTQSPHPTVSEQEEPSQGTEAVEMVPKE